MTCRPVHTAAAALAAALLLAGSSCDDGNMSAPPAAQPDNAGPTERPVATPSLRPTPPPEPTAPPRTFPPKAPEPGLLTDIPDGTAGALLDQAAEHMTLPARLYQRWQPAVLVHADGTSSFADRRLPPCGTESIALDGATTDVAFNLTGHDGRYVVARQLSVFGTVEDAAQFPNAYRAAARLCATYLGEETAAVGTVGLGPLQDHAATAPGLVVADEVLADDGSLATTGGTHLGWTTTLIRVDNAVSLVRIVDLRATGDAQGFADPVLRDVSVAEALRVADLMAVFETGN